MSVRVTRRDREALARRVITAVGTLTVSLKSLEADVRLLWEEFDRLKSGETILGCRTRKEFCTRHLDRTPRAVRYMLKGGNPVVKRRAPRGETVSLSEPIAIMSEPVEPEARPGR